MKLRIQGNSLRLRVTQKEVLQLCDTKRVQSSIELMPGCSLSYALERSHHVKTITAGFDGSLVRVTVPANPALDWAGSDQVTIEGRSPAGAQLLIEKDFQCLHKPAERDLDAFPNPLA